MEEQGIGKKTISLEKAISLLKKDGITVNEEQAKSILEFLTIMANIAVAQYLRKPENVAWKLFNY